MGGQNPIVIILLLAIVYQVYATLDANKKIWCVFRRADRTKIAKWSKQYQARIEFDGGYYAVDAARITTMIRVVGFLPTIVKSLDFTPYSTVAIDPASGQSTLSPEERKALDTSDDMKALKDGNQQTLKGAAAKTNMLVQYMPIITIAGFAILGYFMYIVMNKQDAIGLAVNVAQSQLAKIMQNGGIR